MTDADEPEREPTARPPRGAVPDSIVGPILPEDFTPRLLVLVANGLLRREARLFRSRFGLASNDWRVLSFVALQPGVTATALAELIDVDKALVSRSVTALTEKEMIVLSDGPRGSRPLFLTPEGARMRAAMEPSAMEAYEIIQAHLSPSEIAQTNRMLRGLLADLRERE
ncbi:MarR family winged helix-turn-helix transcriptional regulator [Microbacterium sp.]|uniref:MarR family winged helix-turn-helix transcriptional regulator n=1 Tax=Microbacterium sp. TaxID=51671 RepID=UPI003A85D66C